MISTDTAKQLKNLGLGWEPRVQDEFVAKWPPWSDQEVYDTVASDHPFMKQMGVVVGAKGVYPRDSAYWLPPTETMLKRFQQRGITWLLRPGTITVYSRRKINQRNLLHLKNQDQQQAVAEALAWLLQQEPARSRFWQPLQRGIKSAAGRLGGNWAWLIVSLALAFANRR
jgi:hypothetical protein